MKVGIGFDVHPLIKGEELILGGVHIPNDYGLKGHSDADVLTHALMDAILGAMAKGDIGKHFPDTEEEYKDISSLVLLERVYELLIQQDYRINNIDLIIIAEAPRMAPYYKEIIKNYSKILHVEEVRINLKATTTEKLGFIGRKEGIATQAIVSLVELKEDN